MQSDTRQNVCTLFPRERLFENTYAATRRFHWFDKFLYRKRYRELVWEVFRITVCEKVSQRYNVMVKNLNFFIFYLLRYVILKMDVQVEKARRRVK
jgi:hypothetical protein